MEICEPLNLKPSDPAGFISAIVWSSGCTAGLPERVKLTINGPTLGGREVDPDHAWQCANSLASASVAATIGSLSAIATIPLFGEPAV